MKRKNATRSALITSIISLLLCVSMLVSTTFAWFTDEVVSGNNVIAAGNLDIELDYAILNADGTVKEWATVKDATNLFTGELWEPGHTEVVYLRLANKGTLDLKYYLSINVDETTGTNVFDKEFKLSDYIYMGVVENAQPAYTTRADAIKAAKAGTNGIIGQGFAKSGTMLDGAADLYMAVVVYMPEETDNNANYKTGTTRPEINLGLNLFATQMMSESDSFGSDYDKGAAWTGEKGTVPAEENGVITITSGAELAALAADVNGGNSYKGKTIKLGANIDLNDIPWTPIGNATNKFDGTFIGTGYTISNLFITGKSGVGLFGYTWTSAHIEGVTIDGATVSGNDYVGAILGSGYLSANCVKDCTVKDADITAMPFLMADGKTYDGGAKAGAVVGYARNGNITGNTAIDCTVTAYRDLGGIAGMVSGEDRAVAITGNSVDGVTLSYVDLNGAAYESNKVNENMGDVAGRLNNVSNAATLAADNTATNVTRNAVITWNDNGVIYTKDVDAGKVVLYQVTEEFTDSTLTVPEGVTNLRSKILNGNTTLKEVVIPATVTDFGGTPNAAGTGATGGMFYQSAVEKVTLPEGMTEIPAAAFNQAANLKEVNIPSTVTTIGINAFAGTGLEELYVPATVTSIGYGAFRDMAKLTSVTIEGDVVIANYAFRSCALLENVYILGENTTFTGTSQVFTNNDSTNYGVVNVYVPNETVKQGLLDATQNDASLNITVCDVVEDSNIAGALNTPNSTVLLPAGTYTDFPAVAEGVTIVGQDGVVFKDTLSGSLNNVTIKNVEISAGNAQRWAYAKGTLLFEDCTFDAKSVYAIHYDGLTNANVTYKNCKIIGWAAIGSGAEHVTFDGCEIYGNGTYGLIRLYSPGTIKNCTFDVAAVNTTDVYQDGIHAVDCPIVIENCTNVNGDVTELLNISGTGTIKLDGKTFVRNADTLKTVLDNGATEVYLLKGEYDLNGIQKDGLTLIGVGNEVKMANTTEYASGKSVGAIWQAINLENMTITNTVYTMADGGNSTFTKVNFAAGFRQGYGKNVVFTDCSFGSNTEGYALHFQTDSASEGGEIKLNGCAFEGGKVHLGGKRAYTFTGCDFAADTDFQVWSNITVDGCTVDGVDVTAENIATFFPKLDLAKVTIK